MSSVSRTRGTAVAVQVLSTIVLAAGLTAAPQALTAGHPASAADATCTTFSVPTYVFEPAAGSNIAGKRTLHKYMEWGPKSADTNLLDTQYTAALPATSKVFTGGGNGIIYEATIGGQVKSYKDNTATGGSLLTPVKTYNLTWSSAKRILTNGSRILVIAPDGTTDVYNQSSPATGDGTITKVMDGVKTSVTTSIAAADDAWIVNSAVQWLADGKVQQSIMSNLPPGIGSITPPGIRLETPSTLATAVDAAQAWAPGPGALSTQSVTSDPDTTGQIRSFTTGPWTGADDDVRSGIVGEIMADAGPCLTDPDPEMVPYFGEAPADDTEAPVPSHQPEPAPAASRTVTGKFLLGNGQPASGLPVTVTASDTGQDTDAETKVPVLGTTTTGSDGTWSITLPDTLPSDVQTAKDSNGGVLNLQATADGVTSSGVTMVGMDALTAVPDAPASDTTDVTADQPLAAADNDHAVQLVPNTVTDATKDTFAATTESQTYAAKADTSPVAVDEDAPNWQSDHSLLSADYNPYLVGGKDVSGEAVRAPVVARDSGTCYDIKSRVASYTRYTVVGEAHAGWDTKASFEYSSGMSSSFDIAVKSNGNWSIGGTRELSNNAGISVGFTNQGPHFAKQYKIPIEYNKFKKQHWCGPSLRWTLYTIEAGRYHIPAGGAVGKRGKDVSSKDGESNFKRSKPAHRGEVRPGDNFQLDWGTSTKFGGAVSVAGVSLGAKTSYDRSHKQKITAGNRRSKKHMIWGKNGSMDSHPGVFYSR
ncbi:hypothetical protein [Streptomyces sp. NPDC001340]